VRFDPKTLHIVATVPARGINGVTADGYVWVAGGDPNTGQYDGVITKIDPHTGKALSVIRTPATDSFPFFTPSAGILWLKGATDPFLIRIDMSTGKTSKVMINHFDEATAFGDTIPVAALGSLWLRTTGATVSRLNAHTGRLTATYPADPGGGGGYVAVGAGSLWVANFNGDTVWRDKI
jgi:streptogramin lyase